MNTRRKMCPGIWLALGPVFGLVGCSTQPTFLPGNGLNEVGTISDPAGNTYKIVRNAGDTVSVAAEGVDGDLTLTIDEEGRITRIGLDDGSHIDFQYAENGTAVVSGTGTFGGETVSFAFPITAPSSSTGKVMNRAQSTGDPFLVCIAIDLVCENLEELIASFLPDLIDAIIAENLPMLIREYNKTAFVPLPESLPYPTGIAVVDNYIRTEVNAQIQPYLQQARNFCAHWQLLRLLEISACDF